ncbi:MAG TPA: hypothetical protein VHC22_28955 [Pirellulales bacterium]|nr:hypothetical protein [Pirellulales bacterium]
MTSVEGCLVTASGVDVLWNDGDLYVEKEAGALRRVWRSDQEGATFLSGPAGEYCSVCYDTRYVWAPLARKDAAPRLIVLDPKSEEAWEFTDAEGGWEGVSSAVTDRRIELLVAPWQPGGVCCVRVSGKEQWLGLLEFSPPATRQARPITQPPLTDLRTGMKEMFSLGPIAKGNTPLVVLGRMQYPQLLIDPARQTVVRAKHNSCPGTAGHFVVHERAVWWTMGGDPLPGFPQTSDRSADTLYRANLPELAEQAALLRAPAGLLVAADGRLNFLGDRFCRWDPRSADVEVVDVVPPWNYQRLVLLADNIAPINQAPAGDGAKPLLERAFLSSHHGLLAQTTEPDGTGRCFAVMGPASSTAR